MLKVENVTKRYKQTVAVDNISFEIEPNTICGFVGPNGAGKSTTMNIITGYLTPTSGTVSINGIDVKSNLMEYRKQFGYLPEIPPLYMDMTVEEYLVFVYNAKKLDKSKQKQEIDKVLEMTQTTHVRGRLLKNLSKGYKQRVGMSQAFMGDPKLIILDEPTIGLDPMQIVQVRDTLLELKKNHTILLSSHILSEIEGVCDQIVLINHGNLIASGKKEELIQKFSKDKTYQIKTLTEITASVTTELMKIPGVLGCKKIAAFEYEISASNQAELGATLYEVLAKNHIKVSQLYEKKMNLEDVFLEVINHK